MLLSASLGSPMISNRSTRRASASMIANPSNLARPWPGQLWMPYPKAMWSALSRVTSNRSGSAYLRSSRFDEA